METPPAPLNGPQGSNSVGRDSRVCFGWKADAAKVRRGSGLFRRLAAMRLLQFTVQPLIELRFNVLPA